MRDITASGKSPVVPWELISFTKNIEKYDYITCDMISF